MSEDTDTRMVLHEVALDFVEREYPEDATDSQQGREVVFSREKWDQIAQLDWPGLLVPECYGGHGLDIGHMALVVSGFARRGVRPPLIATGVELPALLLAAGLPEQRSALLKRVCEAGNVIVTALWEHPAAYDFGVVSATAVETPTGYELTGTKLPVAHADIADAFVVLARIADSEELGLFVVESSADLVEVVGLQTTGNDGTGELQLHSTRVDKTARLDAADARAAISYAMDAGAILASAELFAYAQRALDLTVDYVKQRHQFGQPIGSFQAVHHHCADMYRDVEAMRVACSQFLGLRLGDEILTRDVSILKAWTSTTSRRVLERAHQLHGGIGFYTDYPLERLYRRSIVTQGAYGSATWHRSRLIRMLQQDPSRLRRNPSAV